MSKHTCPHCVPEYSKGTKYTDRCKSCKGEGASEPCPRCIGSDDWLAQWQCPVCNETGRVPASEYAKWKKLWPVPYKKPVTGQE